MSGKSALFADNILALILNGTAIPNIAQNAGASPALNIVVSLHTADPGPGGLLTTNEADYVGYARVNVIRTAAGWVAVAPGVWRPVDNITFPIATGGSNSIGWAGFGTDQTGTKLLYSGPLSPVILVTAGVTLRLTTATTLTET